MFSLTLTDAELFVELNRLIYAALDTRTKLLACSLQSGSHAIRAIARNSASVLSTAAQELSDLIRRLGGAPTDASVAVRSVTAPACAGERALLLQCEQAIAQVACQYRDALEWSLPDSARDTLMRQFSALIADYERIRRLLQCAEHEAARPLPRTRRGPRCGHARQR